MPGTDPLPFPSQAARVARAGFVLDGEIDRDQPATSIKARLSALDTQPKPFGRADGLFSFLGLQVGMQVRKRLRRRSGAKWAGKSATRSEARERWRERVYAIYGMRK